MAKLKKLVASGSCIKLSAYVDLNLYWYVYVYKCAYAFVFVPY